MESSKKRKKKVEKESWRKKERVEVESREKKKRMEIMGICVWWRKIKKKEKGKVNVCDRRKERNNII